MHWSLRPGTTDLRTDPKGLHYSIDPAAYEPRCSYCHVWRDKYLRTGRGPVLVEIAGWIVHAVGDMGGQITTREVYRRARDPGINPQFLTAARTHDTDVQSDRQEWWLSNACEMERTGTG